MNLPMRLSSLFIGFILDLILGDPYDLPHPAKALGNFIAFLEKPLRASFPATQTGERIAGTILVAILCIVPTVPTFIALQVCELVSVWLAFALNTVLCYQLLAAKCLKDEAIKVFGALKNGTIQDARYAVSMIVGRDTENLDAEAVTRATIETVAESTSDGVVAPLIFLALGGAALGMLYKAVNTMDSMVGYQNERFINYGRTAAKLDDVLNFFPARIAGLLMCIAALFVGFNAQNAFFIFRRDRHNHKSPNSAHTEAACAGALGISLAGPSYYFGQLVSKPTIGDPLKPVDLDDIPNACKLMYATAILSLLFFCVLPLTTTFFYTYR